MPASDPDAPPSVPLSFSNAFWGRDDAGVEPLLTRMANAKTASDELKSFYATRHSIEEKYARELLALARKPLGSGETGTLRASLDVVRGEVESMAKQHALIAGQMKSELEEPLAAFAGGMKERRKIVQNGVEKLFKAKQTQMAQLNKSKDKYEQDCLRIKGYLAQAHMVMGQEERKNRTKLERTQINMATNSNDYEAAVKVLEETTGKWNKEWKAACDKFQDLEEERLDFTKSSLWAFANIASTVCVSDDAACEKIRLSLENCEVEKDITNFIKMAGTGQEIPDPPRFINFCRGDVDDASEASEDDYAVAQFPRTTNPAFRSSSPNPSTAGTNRDNPVEATVRKSHQNTVADEDDVSTPSKKNSGRPPPLNYRQADPKVPPNYSPSQHGDVAQVPHNEYPTDGMTMYCRAGAPLMTGSGLSANTRPSSRDSASDYSNPTSYTSADPMSRNNSPTKGMPPVNGVELPGMASSSPEKSVQKKRSGFFSNSPFRRKSKRETDHQAHNPNQNRNTWTPGQSSRINLNASNGSSNSQQSSPVRSTPSRQGQNLFNRNIAPEGEEPADPRASFQLNVGNNVFDVASPDNDTTPRGAFTTRRIGFPGTPSVAGDDLSMDPVAQALADLKSGNRAGAGLDKQASMRITADHYHGIQATASDTSGRPHLISAASADRLAARRGTPPPAYDSSSRAPPVSALGVPQPAFTSKEMRSRTENWGTTSSTYGGSVADGSRPTARDNGQRRSRSPAPGMPRAASPSPQHMRARSPGPGTVQQQNGNMRARSPAPGTGQQRGPPLTQGQGQYRSQSPNPYAGGRPQGPPRVNSGMEMQLSRGQEVQRYGPDSFSQGGSGRSRNGMMMVGRPNSAYGGDAFGGDVRGRGMVDPQLRRERSKSMAAPPDAASGQTGVGGAGGVLYYARALYSYTAAIHEELTFSKGDILAVLRLQDDGWWEACVEKASKPGSSQVGRPGLAPSNYLQRC